jgi:glycosyltransferase involved in cell wall biosynthesis
MGAAYGSARHDYIDAADVYVSLSRRENFNFTAAEALASRLPVMLSPGNDLSADLQATDCGWFLPSLDQAADAFWLAASSAPEDRRSKGARGRMWAEAHLRFDTFQSRVRAFAAQVVHRK